MVPEAVLRFTIGHHYQFVPMSVDHKGDEATSSAESQATKAPVEQDESMNTENTSLSSGTPILEDEQEGAGAVAAAIESPIDESKGGIIEWLSGLTADEQAAAMGFADSAFLSAFMAVVPSTNEPETSDATDEGECQSFTFDSILKNSCVCWILFGPQFKLADTTLNFELEDLELVGWTSRCCFARACTNVRIHLVAGRSLDWNSQVLIKDVELHYTEAMNRMSRKDDASSRSSDSASAVDRSNTAKPVDTLHQCLASDVFRIRNHSSEPSSCVLSLLGNACLVLPSAIQHSLGKPVESLNAFVTINPEFLEKVGVEELFAAVFSGDIDDGDSVISSLLVPAEDSTAPLWLKLVGTRHSDRETTALSSLVLERFRQQIIFSYLEYRSSAYARRSVTQANVTEELEFMPSSGELGPTMLAEGSAAPSSWITDARSSVVSLRDLAESMDAVRVAECLEPLLNLMPVTTLKPEDLIFTPLRFLAYASGGISISRLDATNASALKKLISHSVQSYVGSCLAKDEAMQDAPTAAKPANEETSATPRAYDDEELIIQSPIGATFPVSGDVASACHTGSKKKKKKAKKRKVSRHRVLEFP